MITLRMSPHVRFTLFGLIALSLLSGVLFFALKTWFFIEGEFGPEKHPWQFPVLKIHAMSAFAMMLFYGALLSSHVQFGWCSKRSRYTGITIASILAIQVISAYLLYYLSNQAIREITEYLHLIVGLMIPIALITHIFVARRQHKV